MFVLETGFGAMSLVVVVVGFSEGIRGILVGVPGTGNRLIVIAVGLI
jgi:hypothetical protein